MAQARRGRLSERTRTLLFPLFEPERGKPLAGARLFSLSEDLGESVRLFGFLTDLTCFTYVLNEYLCGNMMWVNIHD